MSIKDLALLGLILIYGFLALCLLSAAKEAFEELQLAWWRRHRQAMMVPVVIYNCGVICAVLALCYFGAAYAIQEI